MTETAVAPIRGPTLVGAVAKLLSAGHSPEETLTGVADLVYRGLPARTVTLWIREPNATRFRAITSPPASPAPRTSAQLQALAEEPQLGATRVRLPLIHEGERLGLIEVEAEGALTEERREILEIVSDVIAPFLASVELSKDLAHEVALRAREIEDQRRFISQVIDSLPVGLYVVDRDYRVTLWNRMRELGTQGLRREDVVGRTVFEVLSRQNAETLRGEFDAAFASGELQQMELETQMDGETRHYRISKIPMRDAGGVVSHVITIGEDVTEWRGVQSRIMQSEKLAAVGQLAAGVMHEINNPLATIGACVEAMGHRLAEGGPRALASVREYVEIIEKEVERCTGIVDGLLDFSRPKATARREVNLTAVMEDTLFLLKHHQRFKRFPVRLALANDLPPIQANAEQLVQVFMALMLNSVDAMEGRTGTLTVRTFRNPEREDEVVAEVEDTGVGMSPSEISKIFEPFYTSKPPGRGTGLGLSICYGIVQQHHGRISVDSAPGMGTIFRVTLPMGARPAA
ncbi:MAG: nitrogen regulation protein NR(II) [Gemmatimonadales bacterium]